MVLVMKENLSEAEKGWCAGIIDGEGSVSIGSYRSRKDMIRRKRVDLRVSVQVQVTDPKMIVRLGNLLGGSISLAKRKIQPHCKPSFTWCMHGRQAGDTLALLHPYLVTKQREAEVAIAFSGLLKQRNILGISNQEHRISEAEQDQREALRSKLFAIRAERPPWTLETLSGRA